MHTDLEEKSPLLAELTMLRQRVATLERQAESAHKAEGIFEQKAIEQAALLDAIPASIFFKDREHRYTLVNQAYAALYGLTVDAIVGKRDHEIFPPETARTYHANDEAVMATGMPRWNVELPYQRPDGSQGWGLENNLPYRDASGRVIGMVGVMLDVTVQKQTEEALRRTEAELRATLERQESLLSTIAALSTPVLPVHDGVLVLPLVGQIDTARSAQVMEALLSGVQRHRAAFVIMDLTGVPFVDTAVASHLLRAARAVSLLGAQCIVVGLSPAIAASLSQRGMELSALVTLGDLQAGMQYVTSRRARPRAHVNKHS